MYKLWITLVTLLWAGISWGKPGASLNVPAGKKQLELCARFAGGQLDVSVCGSPSGVLPPHELVDLPAEAAARMDAATLVSVELGNGRRAAHARVPFADGERAWEALVAAPVDGSRTPKLIWSGITGWVEGEAGERKGPKVVLRDHTVLVGEQREDIDLCGRPTLLSTRAVVPSDLSLHPAKVQQLSHDERKRAPRLEVEPDTTPRVPGSLLSAFAASSGLGSPQALTDGNDATFWAENRGGDGRGEFVVLRAPKALALSALHLRIHPGAAAPALGSAPRELWLAGDDRVYHVSLKEDAWRPDAPALRIDLPEPWHTGCLAVVLEEAHGRHKDSQVIISELWASSELGRDWPKLVAELGQGGERARAASVALSFGGAEAFAATAQAFASLGPAAQPFALEVLDQAPCNVAAPAYWSTWRGSAHSERNLHQRRLQRCRLEVAELLQGALAQSKARERAALLVELAGLAPEVLAAKAPLWLADAGQSERKALRRALGATADAPAAEGHLRAALASAQLRPGVQLDLLRALAFRAQRFAPEYPQAFRRRAQSESAFAGQYLLLEPAGALASSEPFAAGLIKRQLTATSRAELREEAVRRADPKLFHAELIAATRDPAVRVRLAAVQVLAGNAPASSALLTRLQEDPWPMVRAAAARALLPIAGRHVDTALAKALDDESRHVRRPVAFVLGRRGARAHRSELREMLQDDEEDPAVRAAAAVAVGQLCDHSALSQLSDYALRLRSFPLTEGELWLGRSALLALSDLRPDDLKQRLQPLLREEAPAAARRLAREALARPGVCATPRPAGKKAR